MEEKNMILHIFMYNVISDFSAVTPASEGRANTPVVFSKFYKREHIVTLLLPRRKVFSLFCIFLAGYVFGYYAQTYYESLGRSKEEIGLYMSWIPLVGGSLSVIIGGLIADYVVRKYGPVARVFVIVISLVSYITNLGELIRRILSAVHALLTVKRTVQDTVTFYYNSSYFFCASFSWWLHLLQLGHCTSNHLLHTFV